MSKPSDTKSFAERFASRGGNVSASSSMAERYKKKENNMEVESLSQKSSSGIANSQADLIYLVKGIDNNRNAWYYVLVERLKLSLFLKALNDDIIHLENYGEVLYSAYGEEPPQDVTDELKKKYNID